MSETKVAVHFLVQFGVQLLNNLGVVASVLAEMRRAHNMVCLRLTSLADRNDERMDVRCFLIHVNLKTNDILLAVLLAEPSVNILRPLLNFFHTLDMTIGGTFLIVYLLGTICHLVHSFRTTAKQHLDKMLGAFFEPSLKGFQLSSASLSFKRLSSVRFW